MDAAEVVLLVFFLGFPALGAFVGLLAMVRRDVPRRGLLAAVLAMLGLLCGLSITWWRSDDAVLVCLLGWILSPLAAVLGGWSLVRHTRDGSWPRGAGLDAAGGALALLVGGGITLLALVSLTAMALGLTELPG